MLKAKAAGQRTAIAVLGTRPLSTSATPAHSLSHDSPRPILLGAPKPLNALQAKAAGQRTAPWPACLGRLGSYFHSMLPSESIQASNSTASIEVILMDGYKAGHYSIEIVPNDRGNPPGKLAGAELHGLEGFSTA